MRLPEGCGLSRCYLPNSSGFYALMAMKPRFVLIIVFFSIFLAVSVCLALSKQLTIGRFSAASLDGWTEKSFHGTTSYKFVSENGRQVLHAVSKGSASGYVYKKPKVTVAEFPLLRWSWRVDQPVAGEDFRKKNGDDFAARVYVVFPGTFFWQYRAICYVWSKSMSKGQSAASPFTPRVAVIALESGSAALGSWRQEERNYAEDYRSLFGETPPDPIAVGFMTDSDNSASQAEAWYGDIQFVRSSEPLSTSGAAGVTSR